MDSGYWTYSIQHPESNIHNPSSMTKRGFSFYAKTLQDLETVGQTTRKFAQSLGFSVTDADQIAAALLEVGQYNLRTTPGILIQAGSINRGRTLKILLDNEKGVNSWLWQAIKDGKTNFHLPELGISHAPRYLDDFNIIAPTPRGATFVLKKHLPLSRNIFSPHAISLAHQNATTNGDAFLIKEYEGDKVLVALIDGEGRGTSAAVLATVVKDYLQSHADLPLLQLAEECHHLLRDRPVEGGIVMSFLRLTPGKIFYLGIGDTHAYVCQPHFRKLTQYSGKVGDYDLPIMEVTTLPTQQRSRFVLCTDGVKEQVKSADLVADFSVERVAENVMEQYKRINGDATVLVVDYQPFG
ncbi:MAG: SpoIIE family protein phosphatase [Saprospiraceae bacterium]